MPIVAADWSVDRQTGNIRYIGADHNGSNPSYATVLELHRWLQGLADDAEYTGNDEVDIINTNPSSRSTDNIVTLLGNYNIDDATSEHLYDGSIIQSGGDVIYDGIVNFGNPGVIIQIIQNGAVIADDWWNYSEGGTHTGSANAATLTDGSKSWTTNEWVGYFIYNVTDGSYGLITANTSTTITATLVGGTENDWDASDAYLIARGLNPDANQGVTHRFMIKTRSGAADIDGRRLIGISRRFGYTYSEFKINGTSRGNNVLALTDSTDLNNQTSTDTVSGWTTITNTTEGYANIDVDNDGGDEYFYSEWNKATFTINQLYERMKWLSRDGSSSTLYGLNGQLFRGITHQVALGAGGSGTFNAFEQVSWSGGTGQMLAIDNTTATSATKMWIQLLTGVAPTATQTITGGGSGATKPAASGTPSTERPISTPFCGVSTGSALIGAYGFGVEYADLSAADTLFDLDNVAVNPPNNVTFTVSGLVNGEDRVLVGPWDGSTLDLDGFPEVDYNQFTVASSALTGAAVGSVTVNTAIPADTPASGTIRVYTNTGLARRLEYSSWSGSTFTLNTTYDFSGDNANIGNNVFISYIDRLANATTATFTSVFVSSRQLVVKVRDGGGSPIKEYISSATLGSTGGGVTAIRTIDT